MILFIFIAALATAVIIYSYAIALHVCRPKRKIAKKNPSNYSLEYEEARIPVSKKTLKAWFVKSIYNDSKQPTVLMIHGWNSEKSIFLKIAKELSKAGVNSLLLDLRGHGESDNDTPIILSKMIKDINAAVEYLFTRDDIDCDRIGILGHSIGACAVIYSSGINDRIKSVVSISSFIDPKQVTSESLSKTKIPYWPFIPLSFMIMQRWLKIPMKNFITENSIKLLNQKCLLIHGDKDTVVPYSNLFSLYDNSNKDNTDLAIAENTNHISILLNDKTINLIKDFFSESLLFSGLEKDLYENRKAL